MKRFRSSPLVVSLVGFVLSGGFLGACSDPDPGTGGPVGVGGTGGSVGVGGTLGGGGAGTGGGAASTGGVVGAGGAAADCSAEPAGCDFVGGLEHACGPRFALGVNYAWHHFAGDFGGIAAWEQAGVANNPLIETEMADMAAHGVSVIRWWMFPDFRGDGVVFDGGGDPTGISEGAVLDLQKALELAEKHDLYLVPTLFSFDNFRPDRTEGELSIRGMTPMVQDAARRQKLIDGVVRPVARAVVASPYAHRLLGWDLMNEPEWAVAAAGLPSNDFDPNPELAAVTLTEMKTFLTEMAAALAEEAPGTKRSVGWAAAKWAANFTDLVGIDFHQPHIYAWVHDYWPYTRTPAELGYGDKPTVMGEFYLQAMPLDGAMSGGNTPFATIVGSWFDSGYAGAWAWQYSENAADLGLIQAFSTEKGCVTKY